MPIGYAEIRLVIVDQERPTDYKEISSGTSSRILFRGIRIVAQRVTFGAAVNGSIPNFG